MQASDIQKQTYSEITQLYDIAEEMIAAIEDPEVVNSDEQAEIAEPFIRQVYASVEEIAEQYIKHVEENSLSKAKRAKAMESAIRRVFHEMVQMVNKFEKVAG